MLSSQYEKAIFSVKENQLCFARRNDPRLSVIVDEGGADFLRLRGIEVRGSAQVVGEVPRTGEAADAPPASPYPLHGPEQLFADKYMGGGRFRYDGRHGWLRVTPAKIVSWDFTKLAR